jgi:hypothetical protein
LAVDSNGDSLRRTAWRAARRGSRGGVPNLLCIASSAKALSKELPDVADRVTIVLPWGELLQAIAMPEPETLYAIADLCQAGASIELVFSYDPRRDSATALPSCLSPGTARWQARLQEDYRRAGFDVRQVEELDQRALLEYPTTWAKRLAHGRPRKVWRIRGSKT